MAAIPQPDVGRAARFRGSDGDVDSYLHVHRRADAWCVLLCETYEFAFSAGWGVVGSRSCGDVFARAWRSSDGSPLQRLDYATEQMIMELCGRAPSTDPAADLNGAVGATFAAVVGGDDGLLHIRWIGDQVCVLVRDRVAVRWTEGHTMRTDARRQGHEAAIGPHGHVITRAIASDRPADQVDPERACWEGRAGDRLVITSGEVIEHATVVEVAACVGPHAPPSETAQTLVDLVIARANPFGVVACVIGL